MTKEIEIEGFGAFAEALEGIYNRPAIPETTGASTGDVLTLGSDGPEWAEVPKELPDSTGASTGDVLSLGASGPEWATPTGGNDYSTDERAVGTFADGKTLYEKTLYLASATIGSGTTSTLPAITGVENVITMSGCCYDVTEGRHYPIPYIRFNDSESIKVQAHVVSGTLSAILFSGNSFSLSDIYYTVRYTKVTV